MRTGTRQGIAHGFSQVITGLEDSVQTDGDLLSRFIVERDEDAFASIVHRHGPLVLGVCRRVIGDWAMADDAFQAVFLVLAQKAHKVHPPDRLRIWLHGVATRTALKARRTASRRQKRETLLAEVPDRPQPQNDPLDPDVVRKLDLEIATLPDHLRAAVVLSRQRSPSHSSGCSGHKSLYEQSAGSSR
jgi:RNA polymerase sigma factor (sigma-70 family)